ncbi:MAG: hypothetical protein ACI8P2_004972 [Candidatus Latescibacterota bacterium]|jgi:hypothetical protein
MDKETVWAWRLTRQGFNERAPNEGVYMDLLRYMQPVAPVHFSMPGSPPRLLHRTVFDDGEAADALRARAQLVKGRFWGGNIGYVLAEDLGLYAAAFCKPISRFTPIQEQLLDILRGTGPITPKLLREETGLLSKKIMPALHRLQRAFLVYEAQEDSSWERPWSLFGAEWPDVDPAAMPWEHAAAEVLRRFLQTHVFATFTQLLNWSQFGVRPLKKLVEQMIEDGHFLCCEVVGLGEGWILPEDKNLPARRPPPCVFMLHKADMLCKSHSAELKERFGHRETLQYLLIDGVFSGAVCGHWRIGAHDVDDVVIDLSEVEVAARCPEILGAIGMEYQPPRSTLLRYQGRVL